MLKDLAGTQDGRHVVLVCSDGMLLYHRHTQVGIGVCEISGERGGEGGCKASSSFYACLFLFFFRLFCVCPCRVRSLVARDCPVGLQARPLNPIPLLLPPWPTK